MLLTCVQISDWCVTGSQTPVCRSLGGANSFVLLRFWLSTQSSFTPSFCSPRLSLLSPALAAPSWELGQGLRGAEPTCGHSWKGQQYGVGLLATYPLWISICKWGVASPPPPRFRVSVRIQGLTREADRPVFGHLVSIQ